MAANNALLVTDINFDQIKANLQTYLSSQSEFQDYDFESSGMQTIIQLLAYNTYYNSIYTNFASNEMFLDSALIRNNVVSRAKMLGFTPSSARGARATIFVQVFPPGSPSTVTIPANTQFNTSIDGISYKFLSPTSTVIEKNSSGNYFGDIVVREGEPVQESYTVSSTSPSRYILNNDNSDTDSLVVNVQQSSSNTALRNYTLATDLTAVNGNSFVYFLQEENDGRFEVLFGDGILGRKLTDGNIVKLNYNVTVGALTNGATAFTGPFTLAGNSTYGYRTTSKASGGAGAQSIDSIKFNAPRNYTAQNRAVTANDYKNILINNAPDLQTIAVWGGEQNSPPIYGKVYISVKPIGDTTITPSRKDELTELLKDRNVVTTQPVFVDPEFLYVVPTIDVRYNPALTAKNGDTLLNQVNSTMSKFNSNDLGLFARNFYLSEFIKKVDSIDQSVINVAVTEKMQRRFIPNMTIKQSYTLNFNNPINNPHAGHQYTISSSGFTLDGFTCYFDDDGNGNVRIYRLVDTRRVYVNEKAGKVDYNRGSFTVNTFQPTAFVGDSIKVNATPRDQVIKSIRNQIIQLADASVSITNNQTDAVEVRSRELAATIQVTSSTETGVTTSSTSGSGTSGY